MKNKFRILLVFVVLAAALVMLPGRVLAQAPAGNDSPVIFGGDFNLPSGQSIKDLVVFGGNAIIQAGASVTGDIVIFGGNLTVSGNVGGNVTSLGGNVALSNSAVVGGDLSTLGGNQSIAPEAIVKGKRITGVSSFPFRFPTTIFSGNSFPGFGFGFSMLSMIFTSLALAALAVLVTLFLSVPTDRVAQTIGTQPLISGAVGLLTLIVAPAIFLVLAITIVLIPLSLVAILAFLLAWLYGWIALGLEIGKRIASLSRVAWSIPVSAGVGTLLLTLVSGLIVSLSGLSLLTLCCIGIPVMFLLSMVGLGGTISSKFGMEVYSPGARKAAPVSSSAPVEPVSPAPTSQAPQPPVLPEPPAEENKPQP